jgi:hypothetical protein
MNPMTWKIWKYFFNEQKNPKNKKITKQKKLKYP